MNLETVKEIISSQGWTPQERKRKRGTLYLYAAKKNVALKKTQWRYIGTVSKLDTITREEILAKLNK